MAVTLTDSNEVLWTSFPIEKTETNEDGDLIVYGKASDGGVDSDQQIVDPAWMAKAVQEWMASGPNIRVQHSPQRDPAGVGLEATTDKMGNTWVKGLVLEPIAQKLVAKGALRAYSVGIARPTIQRDATAPGGRITGGELVEISLVDRPANKRCGIQLVKAENGHAQYTGELFGDAGVIQKALNATMVKSAPVQNDPSGDMSFTVPDDLSDMSLTFTPKDLAKLLKNKIIENHYDDLALQAIKDAEADFYKRDVSTAERRSLAARGHALSDGSYPIANAGDLSNAAHLASTGHGNVAGAKALIRRRAKELGVANPLDDNNASKKFEEGGFPLEPEVAKKTPPMPQDDAADEGDDDDVAAKEAEPVVTKDPAIVADCGDGDNDADDQPTIPKPRKDAPEAAKADMPKKPKKGKKLPPWLNKPSDDASCKMDHVHTEKCHTDPKTASGAEEPADMNPAPVGELVESPAKPHMKSAMLRFKTLGIDPEHGILHDMTCPAYHPDEVAKFYPGQDFATLIDEEVWQRKALTAATGKSLSEAMEAQQAWQAAMTLKNADAADLYAYRLEMHKAFRDANPGPTSALSPGAISPTKFNRPYVTEGHASLSSGYGSPNNSARIPDGAPNAQNFGRPPLSSGHQSPSPSFMKGGMEYPSEQGVITRLNYGELEKEKARRALSMFHDHMNHMFPSACPMLDQDAYRQEQQAPPVPVPAGMSKSAETVAGDEVLGDVYKLIRKLEKKVREGRITEAEAREELSRKTAERYARSLAKQVEKGLTSKDAVLRALGLPPQQEAVSVSPPAAVSKAANLTPDPGMTGAGLTPEVMKSLMAEIISPLEEKINAQAEHITAQDELLNNYKSQFDGQKRELEEHQQRWDALANQPDPSTAAFTGLALNPAHKSARPAGVPDTAAISERVTGMMIRQLERAWRTSENPAEREAAYAALQKYQGNTQ